MKQNPPQGIEDFNGLQEYVKQWIQPCLLGDLRRLVASLEHDFGPSDAQGRPYGAGKFLALGAVLSACAHLGSLIITNPFRPPFDEVECLRTLFETLGGPYRRYQHLLIALGRNAVCHHAWPLTMVRCPLRAGRRSTRYAVVGLGVSDAGAHGYRHFSVHRFRMRFPVFDTSHRRGFTYRPTIVARLFINIGQMVADLDRLCANLASLRGRFSGKGAALAANFQILQRISVQRKHVLSLIDLDTRQPISELVEREMRTLARQAQALKGQLAKPRPHR